MKKSIVKGLALALAALSCVSIASCGGAGGGTKNKYSDVINWETVDWEGKKDSSNKIKIYISNHLQNYYEPVVEAFEKEYPQYDVNVIWGAAGDGVKEAQTTALAGGNPPDLVWGGDVHILNQRGLLLPLNKLIERDDATVDYDDFLDELKAPLMSGEGIYYLPTSFNVSLLAYNKDLFDEEEISYPTSEWTYTDFVTAAKSLTKIENNFGVQWGNHMESSWWTQWYSILTTDGGSLFDEDGYLTLNNEKGIAALEQWFQLCGSQKDAEWVANKSGTHGGADGGGLGGFSGGKVGMFYSIHTGQLSDFEKADIDFEIAPLPLSDKTGKREGTELSIGAYGIHRDSANKKGAWEFLKWLTKKRTSVDELFAYATAVPRKSERDLLLAVPKAERKTKYKNLECIYDAVSYSKALPRFAYFEEVVQDYVVPAIYKMLAGDYTPAQTAKKAQDDANAYIEYRYKSVF